VIYNPAAAEDEHQFFQSGLPDGLPEFLIQAEETLRATSLQYCFCFYFFEIFRGNFFLFTLRFDVFDFDKIRIL
jgi:hypothetical protein